MVGVIRPVAIGISVVTGGTHEHSRRGCWWREEAREGNEDLDVEQVYLFVWTWIPMSHAQLASEHTFCASQALMCLGLVKADSDHFYGPSFEYMSVTEQKSTMDSNPL